jgi:hypothetical protein
MKEFIRFRKICKRLPKRKAIYLKNCTTISFSQRVFLAGALSWPCPYTIIIRLVYVKLSPCLIKDHAMKRCKKWRNSSMQSPSDGSERTASCPGSYSSGKRAQVPIIQSPTTDNPPRYRNPIPRSSCILDTMWSERSWLKPDSSFKKKCRNLVI